MKGRVLSLIIVTLVCSATVYAQPPLLDKTVTAVNATADVILDVTLDAGLRLSGGITGGMPSSVEARAGTTTFTGNINSLTNTYLIVLPAATYTLTVHFTPSAGGPDVTFNDPTPVTVSADTVRDITLPAVTSFGVSGIVSGLNPSFTFNSLGFSSLDAGNNSLIAPDGSYATEVPNGMYAARATQLSVTTAQTFTAAVGSILVNGAPVVGNFTVPVHRGISTGPAKRPDLQAQRLLARAA